MPEKSELSEAKRALLEKYLRGDIPKSPSPTSNGTRSAVKVAHEATALSDASSPLLVVQKGGSKRPFFYAHVHVEGGAFYCIPMARDLGADQPFYLLEPYKLDNIKFSSTFESLAEAYIKAMRAVQPEGPYLLGGFCGGGLIAYEIARQLHAAGQKIDLLILIEPKAGPAFFRMLRYKAVGSSIRRLGTVLKWSSDKQVEQFLRFRHAYTSLRHPSFRKRSDFSFFPNTEYLLKDWIGMFVWMVSRYSPTRYPGKAIYFWSEKERLRSMGSKGEAQEIEMHNIPGTHETCRTDHLHDLASHLKLYIEQASLVSQPTTQSKVPLITVQSGGSKQPFFYMHVHWAGGAFYTIPFAHAMGADQPFYVLDPYQFDGLQVPPTLEAMVAEYVKQIRSVQPEGPYALGGFCGGAIIAFEVAQQLHAAGQIVDSLFLIEAVDGPTTYRMLLRRCIGGFIRGICSLLRIEAAEQFSVFLRIRHVYLFLRYPQYRKKYSLLHFPPVNELRRDWSGIFVWLLSRYVTRQYPGKVTYLWAREGVAGRIRTWIGKVARGEAKEVENIIIPGTHTTCVTTQLNDLAEQVSACLSEARADT